MINFKRDYYGTDFRWTGKNLCPKTQFTAGVSIDAMNEDRQGFQNFNDQGIKGLWVLCAEMSEIIYGILILIYKHHGHFYPKCV